MKAKFLLRMFFVVIIFGLLPQSLFAQQQLKVNDLFEMSFDDLFKITIITAGKKPEAINEIPASVSIITREEIERYGYMSINEILSNIPGLYAIDSHAYPGVVFGVRGFWSGWPRNVIILVNGVEQSNSYGVYHMQNVNMPVEAIDRIEVVRGPMSIMYGSGAFLGAINIITNKNYKEYSKSLVSVSYGSENTRRAALRHSSLINGCKLVFNAGYYDSDGPDEPLSKIVSDISVLEELYGISEANNNLTTDRRLEESNIYFDLSGEYNDFFANISLNQSKREEYHFWPSFSDGLLDEMNFTTILFGYKKKISDSFSIKGIYKYWLSSYWREFDYFKKDFYGQELDNSRTQKIEFNAIYNHIKNFDMIFGVNYETFNRKFKLDIRDIVILNTGSYIDNIDNLAVFSQANLYFSKKVKLILGARFEKQFKYECEYINNEISAIENYSFELKGFELLPRIAVVCAVNNDNVIKLLYGTAVKLPTVFDVTNQMVSGGEDLKSEHINTYEINYIANFSSRYTLNTSIFKNNLNNLLTAHPQFDDEGNWAPKITNSGKMQTIGVEVIVKGRPVDDFLFELSGTYQETKNLGADLNELKVGYSPNLLGHLKCAYHFNSNITISFTGKYVDEMETFWDATKLNPNSSFGGRAGSKVDEYFTLDGNLRIHNFLKKRCYLNIRCSNLFNADYLFPVYTNNRGWADKGSWGYGRKILLTVGRKF
ncbi:TonB-dependent receptor [bacterium]|nr:TonB-dependent receptor [bacterium]